jgi:hypothetical protein
MKNIKSLVLPLVLFISLSSNLIFSQSNTTYNFLKLDIGARAAALGGSFITGTNDVNTIFYNPAALSTLTEKQAAIGFFKYLLDINSGNIAFSQRFKDAGYFGAGIRYINYGSFEGYDEQSVNFGTFGANEIALSLGYSNMYENNFHYGVNLKLIYSNIDEYTSTALAADIGFLYTIKETNWDFGLSLLNAGFQLSEYVSTKEDLPLDLTVGFAKKLEHLPLRVYFEFADLTASVNNFSDRLKNLSVGGEFDFSENVKFRIGYNNAQRQNLETGSSLGIAGFSTGLGVKFAENYTLDYAFNSLGNIGTTNRLDLSYAFK